jgi:hypothetical protein
MNKKSKPENLKYINQVLFSKAIARKLWIIEGKPKAVLK